MKSIFAFWTSFASVSVFLLAALSFDMSALDKFSIKVPGTLTFTFAALFWLYILGKYTYENKLSGSPEVFSKPSEKENRQESISSSN